MRDTIPSGSLAALAAELEPTSPGFAGRLRESAARLAGEIPAALLETYGPCVRRVVAREGAGREAGQALIALDAEQVRAIGAERLTAWCDAFEAIAEASVRAASVFGAAALGVLPGATPEVASEAARAADAVARLARRHGGDPIVQRFAAAAGQALARRGGAVIAAWAEAVEAIAFGTRRALDVATALPDDPSLSDAELASALGLAARIAPRERAVSGFAEVPAAGAHVPEGSRAAALAVLEVLAAADGEALSDALSTAGPVLRRVPAAARPLVLQLASRIARRAPVATPRFLRTVLRVGEAVGFGEHLEAFVERGLALASEHPAAARAFFALESRGALAFLRQHDVAVVLEDVEPTLRGYVQLVTNGRPALAGVSAAGLFPTVSQDPATIPLSSRTDVFPTWEDNFTLLKLQATLATLWASEGTHDFSLGAWLGTDDTGGLPELFARFTAPTVAAGVFTHVEAARLMPTLQRRFPGLAADVRELRLQVFPDDRPRPPHGAAQAILFLALGGDVARVDWGDAWREPLEAFARAAREGRATVYDSASVTAALCERIAEGDLLPVYGIEAFLEEDPMMSYLLEEAEERPGAIGDSEREPLRLTERTTAEGERSAETAPAGPLDPEMLRAFLEQNPHLKVLRADGAIDPTGLFVAGLTGGGDATTDDERGASAQRDHVLAVARHGREARGVFLHDEWDYLIGDYRPQWCRVHEIALEGDNGEFFTGTLARYADVLPEVRRQFLRVKPEGYRTIHGLLDGEDFDLNAVVDARNDLRAGSTPSPKLYVARQREERDVATLFLLDMSASTDEETEPAEPLLEDAVRVDPAHPRRRPRRIIDIQKEALVIMSQALEEIGDLYAIYGFSGHGRDRVELFDVKSFDEPLSLAVRGRIGAIEPQRSTRMGAALRQATTKLRNVASRAKHLILLSDGFPQDFDYGEDRRSNVYGLRDTMMALREAQRAGIAPFCITVDRAGHDYLREMIDEKRYLVIEDIAELPRQLPKIYSEATRGG